MVNKKMKKVVRNVDDVGVDEEVHLFLVVDNTVVDQNTAVEKNQMLM
jgi:hypothetical protein